MFIRVARFEGVDAATRDSRIANLRQEIEGVKAGSLPEGMPPEAGEALRSSVARVLVLVNREDGTETSAVLCATEEDLQTADTTLSAMTPAEGDGSRSDVAFFEVLLDIEL